MKTQILIKQMLWVVFALLIGYVSYISIFSNYIAEVVMAKALPVSFVVIGLALVLRYHKEYDDQ